MAYEHVKTEMVLETAKHNFNKFGSYAFTGGGFTADVVIGRLRVTDKHIEVLYLTTNEMTHGVNYNSVVGHRIKYSGDTLLNLDDNAKLLVGSKAFVKTISKMSGIKFNEKKSLVNLV